MFGTIVGAPVAITSLVLEESKRADLLSKVEGELAACLREQQLQPMTLEEARDIKFTP